MPPSRASGSRLADVLRLAEEPLDRVVEERLALEPRRQLLGPLQEVAVRAEAGEAQVGQPGLARADELALAADLEIALGELEPVRRRDHRLQPLGRGLGELV